eukprot:3941128-Rhodomonas_salina.9
MGLWNAVQVLIGACDSAEDAGKGHSVSVTFESLVLLECVSFGNTRRAPVRILRMQAACVCCFCAWSDGVWGIRSARVLFLLSGHSAEVIRVQFQPRTNYLFASCRSFVQTLDPRS